MDTDPPIVQDASPFTPNQAVLAAPQAEDLVKRVAHETAVRRIAKLPMPAAFTDDSKVLPSIFLTDVRHYCDMSDLDPVSTFPSFFYCAATVVAHTLAHSAG
jgi:hypothetical protein